MNVDRDIPKYVDILKIFVDGSFFLAHFRNSKPANEQIVMKENENEIKEKNRQIEGLLTRIDS